VTFLFSTHDPRLIDAVDRLIRLADGQIEATQPRAPDQLHTKGALA
jgi:ABC-type lipoprotein export system ATPase subunit